jgi:hypothetical protein
MATFEQNTRAIRALKDVSVDSTNWGKVLVEHRYKAPRIYNAAQLAELSEQDDLAGKVARGLRRLYRYGTDAPRIKFDAEKELVRTLASLYAAPLAWVAFAFDWGREGALSLVPFEDELLDMQHGPDRWAAKFLADLGAEVAARPFDRKTPVPAVRMAISSGHSIGKTCAMSWLMLWAMSTRDFCRGVATSATANQLFSRLWPELLTWLSRSIVADYFDTLDAKGSMRLFFKQHQHLWRFDGSTSSPDRAEAFQGLHNAASSTVFLMDEASGVDERIWTAIEGSMVDGAPLLLAFGNPTRRDGAFYKVFHEQAHRWNTRHVDSREAHLTNKEQIEQWLADWGEDSDFARVRILGQFPSQSLQQFIPADLVEQARKVAVPPITQMDVPIIGVDPARFGTDSSSVAIRVGRNARDLPSRTYHGIDTRMLAMEVAKLANELRSVYRFGLVQICVDGIGVGAGVVDTLRGMGFTVQDVQAAGRAIDTRTYANVRAELYGKLRDWMQAGGAIEDNSDLAEDISAADYLFNSAGKLQLEAKDGIRARLGRSPDRSDALALTFAVEPVVSLPGDFKDDQSSKRRNYDPFAVMMGAGKVQTYDPFRAGA